MDACNLSGASQNGSATGPVHSGGAMSTEGWLAAGFGAVFVLLLFATAI